MFVILGTIQSQTYFGSQNIIVSGGATYSASSIFSVDIDGDGDMDILGAFMWDNKIAWYENIDGNGTFGEQQVITTSAFFASCVYSVDLDGDGDMDVLSASSLSKRIEWYENTDGKGTFGAQQVITSSADGASCVYSADIDGDGDMDVLSSSSDDGKIAWYENTDGNGTFGAQQVISTAADGAACVYSVDIDGDGDMDVLSASSIDDKIAWYENTDGSGTFGTQQVITTVADNAKSVYSVDLDGDGDMDVLSASYSDDKIAWYENTDGNGTFGAQQIISTATEGAICVYSSDLDGDGDMDILSASHNDNKIAWYENTDGNGTFGVQQVITTAAEKARSVYSADIDNDGDLDILSASFEDSKIAWYKNTDGSGTFGAQQVISFAADNPLSIYSVDLDGDGDLDVLSASSTDSRIAWYENTDGKGSFGVLQTIAINSSGNATAVYATDLDGDGDIDVISASSYEIAWYENIDGNGTFGSEQVITTNVDGGNFVYAADLDGDGDMDVLSSSENDDKIAWYENTDGNGTFGIQQVISDTANFAVSVYAIDMDGDGDMDVVSASKWDDKIAWYENVDGNGTFGNEKNITTIADGVRSIYPVDLDGDGDWDILSASSDDQNIAWYENTDGNGNFGEQVIISEHNYYAAHVYSADFDGDGDMDVLSGSWTSSKMYWYENTDGNGTLGGQQVVSSDFGGISCICSKDIDGDGDMDILASSRSRDEIVWFENLTLEIITQPQSQIICPGGTAVFSVETNGEEFYKWQSNSGGGFSDLVDNTVYSGTSTDSLTVNNVTTGMDGTIYRCLLNGHYTYSDQATLTVGDVTSPEVTCIGNQVVDADETHFYTVNGDEFWIDSYSDNCIGVPDFTNDFNNTTDLAGAKLPEGTTTIVWTATDNYGNEGYCSFDVTVNEYICPNSYSFTENDTICEGETYVWQGNNYTEAGTYTAEYTTVTGCDSIYTLNLSVLALPQQVVVLQNPSNGILTDGNLGTISLATSVLGVKYWVTMNGALYTSEVAGTGNSLELGNNFIAGTFEVWSRNEDSCKVLQDSVSFTEGNSNNKITVNVSFGTPATNFPENEVIVKLYKTTEDISGNQVIIHVAEQTIGANGQTSFEDLDVGNYYLGSFILHPDNYNVAEHVFYNTALVYEDAISISMAEETQFLANIHHPQLALQNGSNNARGIVGELDDAKTLSPLSDMIVILRNEDLNEIINVAVTDSNGEYLFENIPEYTDIKMYVTSFEHQNWIPYSTTTAINENIIVDFVVNGDSVYPSNYVGLIESDFENIFNMYPNPTNGIINLEFADNNIQKIIISDITGKYLIKKTEIQQSEQIDLSSFESGIYIMTIQTDNEIFTTKIIRE